MNNVKIVMIANTVIKSVAFICITVAAIWFKMPVLLWWYLVPTFVGYSYRSGAKEACHGEL